MVSVSVKWGKQVFNDIPVDKGASVATLKAQLYALTFVPVERQKLMSKAWKGMLKDDADLAALDKLVDGVSIVLMGSAEVVEQPKEATVFIEDMASKDVAAAGVVYPAGLTNLGNTCYMNATLQCLRPVKEFRDALKQQAGGVSADLANNFTTALRDMYGQLDGSIDSITPALFLTVLRRSYPQFAQQSPRGGGFMQQDSEEFLSTLFSTLQRSLTTPVAGFPALTPAPNMIDALFGLEMNEKLECVESDLEPPIVKTERALKLVCNITIETNHLAEGIKIGLEGVIEKNSDVLGRNAQWKKTLRINRLPKYLCVQFMRFYWKLTPESRDHTGVKCKMLRPIGFPQVLDVFEFCSDELKASMKIARDKNAEKILNEFKDTKKADEAEEKKESEDTEMLSAEDAAALEAAKSMSMGARSPGIGLPVDFQGNYELYAILTHKGRSADSGHYMAWVRHEGDDWFCYDDDDVSPCKTEDINKLKGGGDWHMAYLAFYRAKN
uniref:Ubiquitin carboxyl-terminal hydrolase n=1 Tax=Globisporangium ultimum (strain ATCC 200006 / CBS 805.95 / DAOM BR144) TaxID=431595 RepID=K3WGB7_GLOUD